MKKRSLLKTGAVALALAVGVSCFVGCGESGVSVPDFSETANIKIGCSGPLTGGAAIYGTAVYNAAKLAVSEINEAGGVDGIKLSFEMMDDAHDATKVPVNYASLKERGMQLSLGCVTSQPCIAFKDEAKTDNMFIMTPAATSDEVPKDASNVYQMCFSDSGQGGGAALYLAENYANVKLGVFYKSDDVYSRGIYEQFNEKYTGANKSSMIITTFNDGNKTDFSSQITQLKDCDVIFMPIYYEEATLFITQAQGKVNDNAIFFGCDGFDGIDGQAGFDVKDVPQEISFLSHFDSNSSTGKAGEFVKKYSEVYGSETLNQFGASAYDCIYAIKAAIETANKNGAAIDGSTSPSAVCEALKKVLNSDSFKYDGVTGDGIYWNADGTVNKTPVKYVVNK